MRVFYDFENLPEIKNPIVTTGSFDGVHVGHKVIINRLNQLAHESNGESCLITFYPHPRKVLYPESAGKDLFLIYSLREKIEVLRETGLQNVFFIRFTLDFSRMSSYDFVRNILVAKLHAAKVVLGFNHNFGHNREGNYDHLYTLGKMYQFEVEEIPAQEIEHETVSSTRIRKALQQGYIQRANAYLDHHYFILGKLIPCTNTFITESCLSIEIEEENKLIPPPGIYAIKILIGNESINALSGVIRKNGNEENYTSNLSVFFFSNEWNPEKLLKRDAKIIYCKHLEVFESHNYSEFINQSIKSNQVLLNDLIY